MSMYPNADFSEPYSSVSFQYKQLTSPYPYSHNETVELNKTSFLPKKSQITRWFRHHQKQILFLVCLLLLALFCLRNLIAVYWTFLKIKMDSTMFDRGYVACGLLRKEPMLFVQDTRHVQVVWEMNCGMSNKAMSLTYWQGDEKITLEAIEPKVLDPHHTVYKATLGPIERGGTVNYRIETTRKEEGTEKTQKPKVLAKHAFQWYTTLDTEPIRMAAIADNQFGMLTFSSLLRQIRKLSPKPQFLIHAGDAIQNYPSLRQWQTDFAGPLAAHGLGQTTPLIYAHGNHDYDMRGEYTYTRSHGMDGHPWFAFSMANGALRFIVLDSNIDWELQDTWLKHEIQSDEFKQAQFRVVVVHVPPFLEYWDPEAWFQQGQSKWGAFIKDRYVPIFEEGKVDIVISGHQHNYERGERNGVHYAIIGGGGGDLDFDQVTDWAMYEAKSLDFHFVFLEFKPPLLNNRWSLHWDTYSVSGKKVDSMSIESRT
ncbi:hypothetical protein INT47_008238 [Mucor saturninus]|uniref:Calcineurin-like phosphoesterase domain-containing protein n=1 Tax=Mucor saturninus TaxID=64648 RepID=A0A8H7QIT3_9FUNG|nr:hypothetical protein INT47_008238 [Mucor saturninus]